MLVALKISTSETTHKMRKISQTTLSPLKMEARCEVRDASFGCLDCASFEVGIGMIYEWACLSITADCVETRAKARF